MLNSEEELAVYKAARKYRGIELAIAELENCGLSERDVCDLKKRFSEPALVELNAAEGVVNRARFWAPTRSLAAENCALSEVLNWYRRKSAEATQC